MQAEQLARFLEKEKIHPSAIYRGPLKRQIQTAQILAGHFQIPDLLEPVLTEIDYGPWEGLTQEEIQMKWPEKYADWTEEARWAEGVFGGVSPLPKIERWLDHLKKTHQAQETIIAVSSNGLIRYFYAFLKMDWEKLERNRQMEKLKVKTGHFCDLLLFEDRIEVSCWNASPQLNQRT